jgi:hypothetical protein
MTEAANLGARLILQRSRSPEQTITTAEACADVGYHAMLGSSSCGRGVPSGLGDLYWRAY